MKKTLLLLGLSAILLSACAAPDGRGAASSLRSPPNAELLVFADSSMTGVLEEIAEGYQQSAPLVRLQFQFDASGALMRRIQEGAECDLFLSASTEAMDALDGAFRGDLERNPDSLNLLMDGTRVNLLENQAVLAVPVGNAKGIRNFAHLSALLRQNSLLLAVADPDDPLGAYAESIFDYYYLDKRTVSRSLARSLNAAESVTRVRSGLADAAILYRTDADSLFIVDTADFGAVTYCGAVLSDSAYPLAASAFLEYLTSPEASAVFTRAGFAPLAAETESGEYWEAALPESPEGGEDWT